MRHAARYAALFYAVLHLLTVNSQFLFGQTILVEANTTPDFGPGEFDLEFRVTNASEDTIDVDVWIEVINPAGRSHVTIPRTDLTLLPGQTHTRRKSVSLNPGADTGTYTVVVNVGTYASEILGNATVEFTNLSESSETKLIASDGDPFDYFGESVSISGDYAVVGASLDDDNGSSSGSAYIFHRVNGVWVEETKLTPSDGAQYDYFGESVSISGDYAVIGAQWDDDIGSFGAGAAYIFRRDGSTWVEEAKLTASDGSYSDHFGYSVSVAGDHAVIGANLDDDNGSASGSAYVFRREGSTWVEEVKLTASDGAYLDYFGYSVSISGDYAVIGAHKDDDNGDESGTAYVFRREGSTWVEEAKLAASDGSADDLFGYSVSISGDYAVIGAHWDDDNGSFGAGAAYIFRRDGSTWVEEAKLLASDGASDDNFGFSVSISDDYALIGAYGDDDIGFESGSAYTFRRDGSTWVEEAKLLASDGATDDSFGCSVSISGDDVLIGAYMGDDRNDEGSAYIYQGIASTQVSQWAGPVIRSSTDLQEENFSNEATQTVHAFSLSQNHPNPFNPSTEISYALPSESRVKLEVFNTLGQRVSLLVDGVKEPGLHTVRWDGATASGVYFYRVEATALDDAGRYFVEVKKMIYLR